MSIQRFSSGQHVSSFRSQLNALVDSANAASKPGFDITTLPGFIPAQAQVLEISVLNAATLTCILPGDTEPTPLVEFDVTPPWTFTELTRGAVSYVYTDINHRTADGTEAQELTPVYVVGDFLLVGDYENGDEFRDLNIDGRQWAKVP